jgi:adenylate kinase
VPRDESIRRIALRASRAVPTTTPSRSRSAVDLRVETAPILDVYRERGIVDEIDGVGSLDEVFERIVVALAARGIVA